MPVIASEAWQSHADIVMNIRRLPRFARNDEFIFNYTKLIILIGILDNYNTAPFWPSH